jgi:hypothetical protein
MSRQMGPSCGFSNGGAQLCRRTLRHAKKIGLAISVEKKTEQCAQSQLLPRKQRTAIEEEWLI